MALTPEEIAQAQSWINSQWNGGYGANGAFDPSMNQSFDNGVYNFSDTLRNEHVLGAGQAMGYDANAMSQILGLPADQIAAYGAAHQPQSNIYASVFNADRGVADPTAAPTTPAPVVNYGSDTGVFTPSVDPQKYTQNPYLTQMGQNLQTQFNDNLMQNTLPAIRGGAVAAGGVGGSRQGIAEGLATGQSNTGAANAITNLYGQDFNNSMNRNLQQYGMDQNFYLGNQAQNQTFYTQQRGQDLQSIGLGAQLYGNGINGEWSPINNATQAYQPWSGYGSTTTGSTGNNWGAGIGTGLATYQTGTKNGWW